MGFTKYGATPPHARTPNNRIPLVGLGQPPSPADELDVQLSFFDLIDVHRIEGVTVDAEWGYARAKCWA